MRAIIPCAGFGTRMNMKPEDAKEMLEDPEHHYNHIIDYALRFCATNSLDPHVITRKEKKYLVDYLTYKKIPMQFIEPKGEWPDTVLASKDHWQNDNVLILPDTRWTFNNGIYGPPSFFGQLNLGCDAVIATHTVNDPKNWGIVSNYIITEKPDWEGTYEAWGLIGFKKSFGEELFTGMKNPEGIKLRNTGFVKLDSFVDITRNPLVIY